MRRIVLIILALTAALLPVCSVGAQSIWDRFIGDPEEDGSFANWANEFMVEVFGEDAPQLEGSVRDNLNELLQQTFGDDAPQISDTVEDNINQILTAVYGDNAPQLKGNLEDEWDSLIRDLFRDVCPEIDEMSEEDFLNWIEEQTGVDVSDIQDLSVQEAVKRFLEVFGKLYEKYGKGEEV